MHPIIERVEVSPDIDMDGGEVVRPCEIGFGYTEVDLCHAYHQVVDVDQERNFRRQVVHLDEVDHLELTRSCVRRLCGYGSVISLRWRGWYCGMWWC